MLIDIAAQYISANVDGSGGTVCKSKRSSLPPGATAGIECIGDYMIDIGGYYLYTNTADALAVYSARLADYGIKLGGGDCASGVAGDSAWWVPEGTDARSSPWRIGCFTNENGKDNLRLVCHAGSPDSPAPVLYVGLVGLDSMAHLYDFAIGPTGPGYPPRICDPHGDSLPEDGSIDEAARRCPTAGEVALVDSLITMTFVHDPSGADLVCRKKDGSADLTAFQKKGYQGVLAMRWVQFDEPLPWTDRRMFDWFTRTVSGIRFDDVENSYCCWRDREIVISTGTYYPYDFGWVASDGPCPDCGLFHLPGVLAHEARHAEGFLHTCGTDDATFDEMGAWAVHYLWFYWLAKHASSWFMRSREGYPEDLHQSAPRQMTRAYLSNFCSGGIPDEWAPPSTPEPAPMSTPSP
jgi:hypothetical protein